MTNADKIRQMTDEEIAESFFGCSCPPGDDLYELCFDVETGQKNAMIPDKCKKCWLKWLEQEVKDDD